LFFDGGRYDLLRVSAAFEVMYFIRKGVADIPARKSE